MFSTESEKDYLKELQTQIGTVNSEELRVKERQSTDKGDTGRQLK
jgi:hypothetical protein